MIVKATWHGDMLQSDARHWATRRRIVSDDRGGGGRRQYTIEQTEDHMRAERYAPVS